MKTVVEVELGCWERAMTAPRRHNTLNTAIRLIGFVVIAIIHEYGSAFGKRVRPPTSPRRPPWPHALATRVAAVTEVSLNASQMVHHSEGRRARHRHRP